MLHDNNYYYYYYYTNYISDNNQVETSDARSS